MSLDPLIRRYDTRNDSWITPLNATNPPPARFDHCVCLNSAGKFFVFGGRNNFDGALDDIAMYDTVTNEWVNIMPLVGRSPIARLRPTCGCPGNYTFVVMGGVAVEYGSALEDGLWSFDIRTRMWTNTSTIGSVGNPITNYINSRTISSFNFLCNISRLDIYACT